MTKLPFRPKSQNGVSLMELLVATAVLGIFVLGVMSVMDLNIKGLNFLSSTENISQMRAEVHATLQNPKTCMVNFIGHDYSAGNPGDISKVVRHDGSTVIEEGGRYFKTQVNAQNGLQLTEKSYMPNAGPDFDTAVVELTLDVDRVGQIVGAKRAVRSVPLFMKIQNNKVTACSTEPLEDYENSQDFFEKICEISSNGATYYDPDQGKCVETPVTCHANWRPNSWERAWCPDGKKLASPGNHYTACKARYPAGYNEQVVRDRRFPGGITQAGGPRPYIPIGNWDNNTCRCIYAEDLDQATVEQFKCMACCVD